MTEVLKHFLRLFNKYQKINAVCSMMFFYFLYYFRYLGASLQWHNVHWTVLSSVEWLPLKHHLRLLRYQRWWWVPWCHLGEYNFHHVNIRVGCGVNFNAKDCSKSIMGAGINLGLKTYATLITWVRKEIRHSFI